MPEIKMSGAVSGAIPINDTEWISTVEFQDLVPGVGDTLTGMTNGFNVVGKYDVGTPVEIVVRVGDSARFTEPCPYCVAANKDLKDAWKNIREGKRPNGDERTSGS